MSETTIAEETETVTEEPTEKKTDELPADHPLVKTLAAQKSEIKDLKAKAKRLDEIEEAQKSKAEKDADRIAKSEAEAAAVPQKVAEALLEHLVSLHTIESEDVELFLTSRDPAILVKQTNRLLAQRTTATGPKPNPQQGKPSQGGGGTLSAGRELFRQQHPKQ